RIERAMAVNLRSPGWEPHAQTLQPGVFASRFPTEESTLWTIVNRNEYDIAGEQLRLSHRAGMHYYDLWRGIELKPSVHGSEATISFNIEGLSFAAVLAAESRSRMHLKTSWLTWQSAPSARSPATRAIGSSCRRQSSRSRPPSWHKPRLPV